MYVSFFDLLQDRALKTVNQNICNESLHAFLGLIWEKYHKGRNRVKEEVLGEVNIRIVANTILRHTINRGLAVIRRNVIEDTNELSF